MNQNKVIVFRCYLPCFQDAEIIDLDVIMDAKGRLQNGKNIVWSYLALRDQFSTIGVVRKQWFHVVGRADIVDLGVLHCFYTVPNLYYTPYYVYGVEKYFNKT